MSHITSGKSGFSYQLRKANKYSKFSFVNWLLSARLGSWLLSGFSSFSSFSPCSICTFGTSTTFTNVSSLLYSSKMVYIQTSVTAPTSMMASPVNLLAVNSYFFRSLRFDTLIVWIDLNYFPLFSLILECISDRSYKTYTGSSCACF